MPSIILGYTFNYLLILPGYLFFLISCVDYLKMSYKYFIFCIQRQHTSVKGNHIIWYTTTKYSCTDSKMEFPMSLFFLHMTLF